MLQANQKGVLCQPQLGRAAALALPALHTSTDACERPGNYNAGIPPHRQINCRHRINVASRNSQSKLAEML